MRPERIVVFLPCHSFEDFPTWLDEREADELLAAWTAAWHPALIAAVGHAPGWSSVEVPPADPAAILGIVPAAADERFAAMLDAAGLAGSRFVRGVRERGAIVAAAVEALEGEARAGGSSLADDFHALGLAWLLAELLARRMRSSLDGAVDGFSSGVVAAARAAVAGDDAAARDGLHECFATLEATRSRYYPVDVWLLDIVLLAESTLGSRLAGELGSPVPLACVATARLLERLGSDDPALLGRLRDRVAAGAVEIVGGREDATPVDFQLLETLRASFERGHATYRDLLGRVPVTFGQCSGGSSAYLPGVLVERGYRGAIWNLFDGTPLPDPGSSRIRWQGVAGGCIEAFARPPLDARSAGTILQLPDKVGDAMDHDHSCIVSFAHYAGTASPWFADLRRIAAWTTLLGRFVTPAMLFAETEHAGVPADVPADAFPPTLPGERVADAPDPVDIRVAAAAAEASAASAVPTLAASVTGCGPAARPSAGEPGFWARLAGGFHTSRGAEAGLVLENAAVRLEVHPRTGGVLSLRSPGGRGNRLSQALAVRTTRPAPPAGGVWESAEERAEYSRMVAERVDRESGTLIVSRGVLVTGPGTVLGSFTQRFGLVGDAPLVRLDIHVDLRCPIEGPLLETHVACRFAWNENDDLDLRRSLHGESIATSRTRFTAPHFLEVRPAGPRHEADAVLIATGGLPWHVRTTPHTVDSILAAPGTTRMSRRLALGLGIATPLPVALALLREQTGVGATA
ncbi:MAG: hypothetical protein EBR28_00190 [Planctomycetia bacterium]|nr:hypothetical protein [Planctomycetia bacterium]